MYSDNYRLEFVNDYENNDIEFVSEKYKMGLRDVKRMYYQFKLVIETGMYINDLNVHMLDNLTAKEILKIHKDIESLSR